jgi:hypothetical protein
MTLGQLMQSIIDIGTAQKSIQPDIERSIIKSFANLALQHTCNLMRIPRFCYRGPLEPKRTVYKIDFEVSDVTRVIIYYEGKDYPLYYKDINMMSTGYGKYDSSTHTPELEYATEQESVSPSGIRHYSWEVRAASANYPEGACLVWIRPPSNVLVPASGDTRSGLWIFGIKALKDLNDETSNIPISKVLLEITQYWALWLLTQNPMWITTYDKALLSVANYAPGDGEIDLITKS